MESGTAAGSGTLKSTADSSRHPADHEVGATRRYVAPRLVRHGDLRGLTLGGSVGIQESPGYCIPGETECAF